jgi:hypothetical protein
MQLTDGAVIGRIPTCISWAPDSKNAPDPPTGWKMGCSPHHKGFLCRRNVSQLAQVEVKGRVGGGTERQTNPLEPNKPTTPLTGWCQCVQSLELLSHMRLLGFD